MKYFTAILCLLCFALICKTNPLNGPEDPDPDSEEDPEGGTTTGASNTPVTETETTKGGSTDDSGEEQTSAGTDGVTSGTDGVTSGTDDDTSGEATKPSSETPKTEQSTDDVTVVTVNETNPEPITDPSGNFTKSTPSGVTGPEVKSCGNVDNPQNGKARDECQKSSLGSICRFDCDKDFPIKNPNAMLTCSNVDGNLQWTGEIAKCAGCSLVAQLATLVVALGLTSFLSGH